MQSLLNAVVDFPLLTQGYQVGLNWLGHFARVIIEGVGIVGLGIILFTLVLKAITLPFDIYQRVKMRKQTLIMRSMKDDLDKLQKQYANDKTMYNTKMMELYKKNGYSMLGACLPLIISLVILIVAFQGFRTYSQYANLQLFVEMSESYNAAILEHGVDGAGYRLSHEGKEDDELTLAFEEGWTKTENGVIYEMFADPQAKAEGRVVPYMRVTSADDSKYIFYEYNLAAEEIERNYKLDTDKLYSEKNAEAKAAIDERMSVQSEGETLSLNAACYDYVVHIGASAAAESYEEHNPGFLWVRNVWYPDVSYNHPIPSYSGFSDQLGGIKVTFTHEDGSKEKKPLSSVLPEQQYENLTSELAKQKKQANGYFILIALSIGMMVLSQLLTMKSSKESNQYQTVDGRGVQTQKVMLVVMPLIYAVFAFMYSAAFSIYMTMSSVISLVITLLSNVILDRIFNKKEEEQTKAQYGRKLPWMEEKKAEEKKNAAKKEKKNPKKG